MSAFVVKGWCPSALRPMLSGDGLVVRLRPRGGRLSSAQAAGIAELSARHGNGLIDLTGRANLQIRGVREESHEPLSRDSIASGWSMPSLMRKPSATFWSRHSGTRAMIFIRWLPSLSRHWPSVRLA